MQTTDRSSAGSVTELLRRGGLVLPEQQGETPAHPSWALPDYNGLHDPQGAELLGSELGGLLERFAPTRLLIWQDPADLVLGYVVARRLGVSAVRSYDLDGLVAFDGEFGTGARIALVADAFRDARSVRAMCALARQQGHEVAAAGALVDIGGAGAEELDEQGVPLASLVKVEPAPRDLSR